MFIIILLAIIGCIIQGAFIIVEHKEKYVPAVILKGSASLLFVAIGIYSIVKVNAATNFPTLVLVGLILGAVGDILLNLRFVFPKIGSKVFLGGVASFLIGHILYLIALFNFASDKVWIAIIVGIVVAALILTFIFMKLKVKLSFKIFGVLYIGAVSLMASVAIANLICNQTPTNISYAIGAVLFLISDVVLIFNSFGPKQLFSLRITNLSLYYLGQILIALSIFLLK